jgi:putative endonuclease
MPDDDPSARRGPVETSAPPSTRVRGQRGEQLAAAHLGARGLEIVERNVTIAGAEIDLIARAGDTVVFVEVRGRSDDRRGHPFETVDARKQARIRRAATGWLIRNDLWDRVAVRFDVVAIVGDRIEWLTDAF